jgi:hypothetical protein
MYHCLFGENLHPKYHKQASVMGCDTVHVHTQISGHRNCRKMKLLHVPDKFPVQPPTHVKNLVDRGHTSKLMPFEIHQHNIAAVSHYRSGTGRRKIYRCTIEDILAVRSPLNSGSLTFR